MLNTALSTALLLCSLVLPQVSLAAFSDIAPQHAHSDALVYLEAHGIVSGYPDGTFGDSNVINRAEFTKIIVGATQSQNEIDVCLGKTSFLFKDVSKDQWYAKYICVARAKGIVNGYADGTFQPATTINFVEAAKILSIAFSLSNDTSVSGTAPWYEGYVRSLAQRNAIPLEIGKFNQALFRGEMAEMSYRLHAKVTTKESQSYEQMAESDQQPNDNKMHLRGMYSNPDLGLSFNFMDTWGTVIANTRIISESDTQHFTFSALQDESLHPNKGLSAVDVSFRTFDTANHRYYEVCGGYEGACEIHDLVEDKEEIEGRPTFSANGIPVRVFDWYSPEAGVVLRTYTFFIEGYRVRVRASYDVFEIYDDEYKARQARGEQPSISELVREDIGQNFENPIHGIFAAHPEKAEDMNFFFLQVETIVRSASAL